MIDYIKILELSWPDKQWSAGETYESVIFHDGTPKPSKRDMDALWESAQDKSRLSEMRKKRNRLLSESDWTQIDDCPLSKEEKRKWRSYRKKLRNLTEDPGKDKKVKWPKIPTEKP